MLTKINICIIFLPFFSVLLLGMLFLLFQIFSNKNYLSNLVVSFFLIFFLVLIVIYKINSGLTDQQIFYLIFAYLCSSFIFMCIIQAPISSIQLTMLRMIYLNPGINRKEILKKFNSRNIFEERIRRLETTNIIYKNKSSFFLKNKKILLYFNFTIILKKIFNINN